MGAPTMALDPRAACRADTGSGETAIADRLAGARERERERDDKQEREAKAFVRTWVSPFRVRQPTAVSRVRRGVR